MTSGTKMLTIPGVELEFDEYGGLVVRQDHHDGYGPHWVELHSSQVQLITAERGFTNPILDRIIVVRDELADLVSLLASVPMFPPGEETQDVVLARKLLEKFDCVLNDLGVPPVSTGAEPTGQPIRPDFPHPEGSLQAALPGLVN